MFLDLDLKKWLKREMIEETDRRIQIEIEAIDLEIETIDLEENLDLLS